VKRGTRKPPPEWIIRVRWTRGHWEEHHGSARWNARLFQSPKSAARFALRLGDTGARVEWTCWKVDPRRVAGPREDLEPLAAWLERVTARRERDRPNFRSAAGTPESADLNHGARGFDGRDRGEL
jgi:hypothetical protein